MSRATVKSNTVAETSVSFFSAGGHNHDGINSSIIDTTRYSVFDFNFGFIGTNSQRVNNQTKNERAFRDFIIKTVNQSVLEPAGVVLQDNIINSRNIIAGSITAEEIAANTITANNIAAGTIVANLIAAGTITGDLIAANTITSVNIAANTITAAEIAAESITSELLQANIVIGNNATFTGTVSAANIIAGTIDGTIIQSAFFSSAPGSQNDRIVIIPGESSETANVNSLRFLSLPAENFDNSPSMRATEGVLQISGSGARQSGGRINFGSVTDGIRITGAGGYMQQEGSVPSINSVNNRGYFRNISYGSTTPSNPNLGDIHFTPL